MCNLINTHTHTQYRCSERLDVFRFLYQHLECKRRSVHLCRALTYNTIPGMVQLLVYVVVVDSHIQRIVLATEETTVTQQVSHRPIKRQSRLWSQRGTKVNGSHHGDNPLLRPTGIQIATKSYAALQAMAPTNIKTVHQTSLLHSRATSIDSECCRLPTTSVLSKKTEKLRSNQF